MRSLDYLLLRKAVLERKQVFCVFQGLPRELCPHVLGDGKLGEEKLLSFQFGGRSSSGLPPGGQWRCMAISEMSNITVRDGDWHTGSTHLRPQTCVKIVDVAVRN